MMRDPALIATTRFGLGPVPGLIEAIADDPRGYVAAQCDRADASLLSEEWLYRRQEIADLFIDLNKPIGALRRQARGRDMTDAEDAERVALAQARNRKQREISQDEVAARFDHAVATDHPFVERLTLFWSNHFAVDGTKNAPLRFLAGVFEREAIRPHVLGYFEDMLVAATTHPAMLHYLDNILSIGPNSFAGKRRGGAVNENLAREVLELHTLGAGGGYTQADVVELANALSGWVGGFTMNRENPVFKPRWHEPGPRTILGEHFATEGQDQLLDVLPMLARHPSTARHVAEKLARHFVQDEPDPALVEALEDRFLVTGGDLRAVSLALVEHDAAWIGEPHKTVPPYDFMVGAVRGIGQALLPTHFVIRSARDLAQQIFAAPSPAGWPDDDTAFLGGDSLLERVDFARHIANRFSKVREPRDHARALFAHTLDPFVAEAVDRAEDRRQAMVLLLMSPPYHRR